MPSRSSCDCSKRRNDDVVASQPNPWRARFAACMLAGEIKDPRLKKKGLTYRDAGVDIDAQDEALRRIKGFVKGTRTPGVLADLGSFGG